MGFPASFDESNAVLGAPNVELADEVLCLSILRTKTENGTPVIVSCWKFTAEEMEEISRTGRVWLVVAGHTMPPCLLQGQKTFHP